MGIFRQKKNCRTTPHANFTTQIEDLKFISLVLEFVGGGKRTLVDNNTTEKADTDDGPYVAPERLARAEPGRD